MRNFLIAAAAITALSSGVASAADIAARPYTKAPIATPVLTYDWSGIYIGGNIGGEWGNIRHNHYAETVAPGPFALNPSYTSAIGGGQVGAQYMFSSGIIVGIEAAYSEAFDRIKANQLCPSPPIAINSSCNQTGNGLFTVGGRLGISLNTWSLPNWMVYGTAGYAQRDLSASYSDTATGNPNKFPGFNGSSKNDGWYAGVGVEAVAYRSSFGDVILGAEYQHFELDSKRATTQLTALDNDNISLANKGDIVRARLSLKFNPFGGPVVAKY